MDVPHSSLMSLNTAPHLGRLRPRPWLMVLKPRSTFWPQKHTDDEITQSQCDLWWWNRPQGTVSVVRSGHGSYDGHSNLVSEVIKTHVKWSWGQILEDKFAVEAGPHILSSFFFNPIVNKFLGQRVIEGVKYTSVLYFYLFSIFFKWIKIQF